MKNKNNNIISKDSFWSLFIDYIKQRIQEQHFQTWFSGLKISTINDEEIIFLVPNKFHYEWLESKYRLLIDDAIKHIIKRPLIVNYSVVVSEKKPTSIPSINNYSELAPSFYRSSAQINNFYTFENFIEGRGNQLAKAAALSVAENLGTSPFNPLLIYSKTGLGKTHLLQAIGNYTMRFSHKTKLLYLTSEMFMHEFISAIQENKTTLFAKKYRCFDLLLIDDVQFFQNKEQTQEQFFHLFNDLYQKNKQIVLTTDRPPQELQGLKERLVSRFKSGLTVDIQPPDLETRIAILQKKADYDGLDIPYDVTEFIASCINGNVRDLEGSLRRLMAFATLKHQDITIDLAKKVIKDLLGKIIFNDISVKKIVSFIAKELKIKETIIVGKGRQKEAAFARQLCMYLSRELTGSSLNNIGSYIGQRNHSTVIHACKIIENKISTEANFKIQINNMKKEIQSFTNIY